MAARFGEVPRPPDLFIGRAADLVDLGDLLSDEMVRMVTILGPAGVGKTSLAIAVTERTSTSYADGVVFVALPDVRDPDMFPSALAAALGVADLGARTPNELVIGFLRDRQVLLCYVAGHR